MELQVRGGHSQFAAPSAGDKTFSLSLASNWPSSRGVIFVLGANHLSVVKPYDGSISDHRALAITLKFPTIAAFDLFVQK